MKGLALALITLLIAACAPSGKGSLGKKSPEVPIPIPSPKPVIAWGDLRCQKKSTCRSLALNLSLVDLAGFLNGDFDLRVRPGTSEDAIIYQCGLAVGKAWTHRFGGDGMDSALDNFFLKMIDPKICRSYAPVIENLNTYFMSTQEYKDEVR